MQTNDSQINKFLENFLIAGHKKAYLKSLKEKRDEFLAVKQLDNAEFIQKKIEFWIEKYSPKASDKKNKGIEIPEIKISKLFMERELAWIKSRIELHSKKIPKIEITKFVQKLNNLSEKLDHLCYDDFIELLNIRINLQDRLHQSIRAIKVQRRFLVNTQTRPVSGEDGTVVSIYNDSATLKSLFSQITESDPLWVADFLQLYGEMFGLEEHLNKYIK